MPGTFVRFAETLIFRPRISVPSSKIALCTASASKNSTYAKPFGLSNEGYNDVAAVFRSTAEGETGHAHGHLEYLEETGDPATGLPIGGTSDNLKAAVAGETHEYTDMYPGMAKTARDEGFDEIADWFETLGKAERSHANRFQKALDSLDG